ncbi:hypothetical protein J437_LFUL001781 [Ladona fulva]|uniref:G-protein coupled receptors family 1 profile domain-containing protein n=1 Tax=Ladona fulva TaxID=123851 RepID=A0A8K0JWT3_LADFU|nr:hypothetical protein J437_LFUL001781 [Ladona fulva]
MICEGSEKVFKSEMSEECGRVRRMTCGAGGSRRGGGPGEDRRGRRGRGTHRPTDLNRCRLMRRAKIKSLRISVVIVVAFVVWWTPYYTMMIIFIFLNPDKHLSEDLQSGIFFFGMSNSLVNPLIYGAFHLWRPSGRRSSYRSTGCNRDGSTRRSTATNVSMLNRSASRSKGAALTLPNTASHAPRHREEETSLVSSPDGTIITQPSFHRKQRQPSHYTRNSHNQGQNNNVTAHEKDGKLILLTPKRGRNISACPPERLQDIRDKSPTEPSSGESTLAARA